MIFTVTRVELSGYRSIAEMDLRLGRVNVLIGPNGAGKSNLLSFLQLVPRLRTRSLRLFVAQAGGADALLHQGSRRTQSMSFRLKTDVDGTLETVYGGRLEFAADNSLFFGEERIAGLRAGEGSTTYTSLGTGHSESHIEASSKNPSLWPASIIRSWMMRMNFFHFHDTSLTSPLRGLGRQEESDYLRSDGRNLAPYLYRLANSSREEDRAAFARIESLTQRIAPYVKSLLPVLAVPELGERSTVRLDWMDVNDCHFGAHQLSDGTLRALALFTALAQPANCLPGFVIIDEPELGLHPAALALFVDLVRSVSSRCQVILATQAPALLDHFEPQEVVVVEAPQGISTFRRLDANDLAGWLEDYRLSELFDQNVLGGRP